jgi:hypothetical protein
MWLEPDRLGPSVGQLQRRLLSRLAERERDSLDPRKR